jgi:uncharacterized protein YndB with AHSA1/START domain
MGNTKDMKLSRLINAPLHEVWQAWVEPGKVKLWWGPTGFTCPRADMDVREGGRSLVCMRAPKEFGGMDMFNTWTYTKVVPNERLEFVNRFSDKDGNPLDPAVLGLPEGIPKEVPHVVTFAEKDGGTEVTIVEEGYTSDQAVETSRQGMQQVFDKMEALFA